MPLLGFWAELTIGRSLGAAGGEVSEAPEKGT